MERKQFKEFLLELTQDPIYKDFKKSFQKTKQLPLPFEFEDEFFQHKKEQIAHALREMGKMQLGYEFELYVEKQEDDSHLRGGGIDYDAEPYPITTENFRAVRYGYMSVLEEFFPERWNRSAYSSLDDDYNEWQDEKINEKARDLAEREFEDLLDEEQTDEKLEELIEQHKEDLQSDPDFEFDSYVQERFGIRDLLNLIHHFDFDSPENELGFDRYGHLITEVEYPESDSVDVNTDEINTTFHYPPLAKFLQSKVKSPVKILSSYHNENKQYKTHWYLEPDGSLDDNVVDYFPVEITTKIYPAYQFKELFLNTIKYISEYGAVTTDSSTGFHFSVSFLDSSTPIDFVKLIVLGSDKFWLKKVGRSFNNYCQSQLKKVKEVINDHKEDFLDLTVHNLDDKIRLLIGKIHISKDAIVNNKFMSINLSKYSDFKFIEFRIGGNDYISNKNRHLDLIEWFLYIFVIASTPNLFREEYVAKLKSLIEEK